MSNASPESNEKSAPASESSGAVPVFKRPGFWIFIWAICVSSYYAATRVAKHNNPMPPAQVASTRPPATAQGAGPMPGANNGVAAVPAPAVSGGTIEGTIELTAALAAQFKPTDTIYLIARRGQAGPPVAAKKLQTDKFPVTFSLTSADVMFQGVPFEGELDVVVRIDKDGDAATKTPGDMMGKTSAPVAVGSKGVKIVIDQTL